MLTWNLQGEPPTHFCFMQFHGLLSFWPWPSGEDFVSADEEDEVVVETDKMVDSDSDDHSDVDAEDTAAENTVNGQSSCKATVSENNLGPGLSN